MEYLCNIYPRENCELTAIHEIVNGKIVTIADCEVGKRGHIFGIKGGGVHTSTIQEVDYLCEGDIRIVTCNSIYELTKVGGDNAA